MTRLFAAGPPSTLSIAARLGPILMVVSACSSSSSNNVAAGPGVGYGSGPPTSPGTGSGSTSGSGSGAGAAALSIQNGTLIDPNGNSVSLHGVTWYGFDSNTVLANTNQGSDTLAGDFATAVYRLQLLGFNTVRLPFSFANVLDTNALGTLTQVCTVDSNTQIASATTDPQVASPPAPTLAPGMRAPPLLSPGTCNAYIPYTSAARRFAYAVSLLAQNGFYVILADREAGAAFYTAAGWPAQWTSLLQTVATDPNVAARLLVDLIDEPDRVGLTWTDLATLYPAAMTALTSDYPDGLFLIEGAGQQAAGASPGDGFVVDAQTIASAQLSDPNPFFKALVKSAYVGRVILAPHVDPPSITGRTQDTGTTLWQRLSASFGPFNDQGYCGGGSCVKFPVVMGGMGSGFDGTTDLQMMIDLAAYLTATTPAQDGLHNAIDSWVWSSYYQNGTGTVGLVDNTTWKTVQWTQPEYLMGVNPRGQTPAFMYDLSLVPWY